MSRIKTIFCTLALCSFASPGVSFGSNSDDLTRYFARCAGQMSALMEFQWLTNDPASEETEADRERMVDLLAAVMSRDTASETLALRISAKQAFSTLLTRSHFNDDPDDIAWAQTRIAREIANCRGMLLN